uniref:BTB domain-containing protein n=1 Tax=Caenorhabditis japonica TaxID=281687 RepID=A0A8R1IP20_CAEJA
MEPQADGVFLGGCEMVPPNGVPMLGVSSQTEIKVEMRIHPNPSHSDYVSYIKRDVLFPQIMPRDMIIVNVEIDVAVETITTTNEPIAFEPVNTERQLSEDYKRLFLQELLCDFVINVGGREINAHKAVLSARSPVFNAMLTHCDTDESKMSVMYITDMDYDVIYEMVYYIYCGHCQKDITDMATALLIAADKYRLDELKNHCEKYLVENINLENVCSLLIIGDMYTAPKLRRRAVQFILARPKNVTGTAGWEDILKGHPNLITDIFSQIEKQSSTGASSSATTLPGIPIEIPGIPGGPVVPPPSGL